MRNATHKSTEKGFTLIEMAIVVAIVGMVLASVAQLYQQRIQFLQVEDTRSDVETITQALGGFLDTSGRFPCPASLTAVRGAPVVAGEPSYGRESDCSDGVAHTIVATGLVTTADNVRIGTVPFKELGLEENQSIDGYHNRLIYAVTETQAVQTTFAANGGVIRLLDEDGNLATPIATNLHFVLYSTGENGVGGYSREGAQTQPCRLAAREAENCDFNNSIFISAQKGSSNNNLEFDDIISYNTLSDMPKWEEAAGSTENINSKAPGGLGIGPGVSKDPEEELDVVGIIRAQDNPHTTDIEGTIRSSSLCENRNIDGFGNDVTKCFPSELIGKEDAPHPDMKCPAGQFMLGITNGKAECSSNVEIACPIGQLMVGVNADGTPKCNKPLPGCPSISVPLCPSEPPKTLLAAKHGDKRNVTGGIAGNPRSQTYLCSNGSWRKYGGVRGLCSCVEEVTSTRSYSCQRSWKGCGNQYTGSFTRTTSRQCPSGKPKYSDDRSSCSCIESVKIHYPGCGSGYNQGYKKRENKHNCTTQKCGGWKTVHNSCGCKAEDFTQWKRCPSGFTGWYQIEKKRQCPSGEFGKYKDTAWTEVPGNAKIDRCKCQPSVTIRKESCPDGQFGDIATRVELTCPDETKAPVRIETPIINKACEPLPPIQCRWQWPDGVKSPDKGSIKIEPLAGERTCDCDTEQGDKKKCSTPAGSDYHYENCVCEVTSSE